MRNEKRYALESISIVQVTDLIDAPNVFQVRNEIFGAETASQQIGSPHGSGAVIFLLTGAFVKRFLLLTIYE